MVRGLWRRGVGEARKPTTWMRRIGGYGCQPTVCEGVLGKAAIGRLAAST
jgi:hypothetical protein